MAICGTCYLTHIGPQPQCTGSGPGTIAWVFGELLDPLGGVAASSQSTIVVSHNTPAHPPLQYYHNCFPNSYSGLSPHAEVVSTCEGSIFSSLKLRFVIGALTVKVSDYSGAGYPNCVVCEKASREEVLERQPFTPVLSFFSLPRLLFFLSALEERFFAKSCDTC